MTKRKTGLEQYYILKNNKKLHYGYTTGTCAAAASKAAAEMLLSGHKVQEVELIQSGSKYAVTLEAEHTYEIRGKWENGSVTYKFDTKTIKE